MQKNFYKNSKLKMPKRKTEDQNIEETKIRFPPREEITKINVEQEKKEEGGKEQLVAFKLAGEEYAININEVREIIKIVPVTRIPGTSDFINGVINLRGQIISVIDLEKRLNLQVKEPDKDSRIVIVEIGDQLVGMIVDFVSEVMWLQVKDIKPAPPALAKKIKLSYLRGVGVISNRLLILLDLGKLLSEKEIDAIASIHKSYK